MTCLFFLLFTFSPLLLLLPSLASSSSPILPTPHTTALLLDALISSPLSVGSKLSERQAEALVDPLIIPLGAGVPCCFCGLHCSVSFICLNEQDFTNLRQTGQSSLGFHFTPCPPPPRIHTYLCSQGHPPPHTVGLI